MATQTHTNMRLATFIARGNMGPAQIQIPELVPAQAAVQQPAAAQAPAAPVPGGGGPAHPQGGGGPQHQEVDHQEEDLQYQEEEDLQHQEEEDKQRPLLRETHTHLGCVATRPKYSMAINRRPIDLYRNSSDIT